MSEDTSNTVDPHSLATPSASRDLSSTSSFSETTRNVNFDQDLFETPVAELPQYTVKFIFPANKDPDTIPTYTPAQLHSMILLKLYDLHRGYFRAISDIKNAPLEMKQRQKLRTKPNAAHSRYFNTHLADSPRSNTTKSNVPTEELVQLRLFTISNPLYL